MPNECGDCAMCCKLVGVHELRKPVGVWCAHARPGQACGGCGIYEDRPPSCKTYQCGWLQGNLPANLRPDRCKVVLEQGPEARMLIMRVARENFATAWRREDVMHMIASVLARDLVVVYTDGPRSYLFKRRLAGWVCLEGERIPDEPGVDIFNPGHTANHRYSKVLHTGLFSK